MGKESALLVLVLACSLQFVSWHGSLSASCWPPVLPDGCDLNQLNGVKKLLDFAKSLFTNFQLKSANSSEILVKNLLLLRWSEETYKVKQINNTLIFLLALALNEHGLKMPVLATTLFGSQYSFIQYFEQRICSLPRFCMTHSSWWSLSNGCALLDSRAMLSDKQSEHIFSPTPI